MFTKTLMTMCAVLAAMTMACIGPPDETRQGLKDQIGTLSLGLSSNMTWVDATGVPVGNQLTGFDGSGFLWTIDRETGGRAPSPNFSGLEHYYTGQNCTGTHYVGGQALPEPNVVFTISGDSNSYYRTIDSPFVMVGTSSMMSFGFCQNVGYGLRSLILASKVLIYTGTPPSPGYVPPLRRVIAN
jgi:hypothetical protein